MHSKELLLALPEERQFTFGRLGVTWLRLALRPQGEPLARHAQQSISIRPQTRSSQTMDRSYLSKIC
jgi:hypothetical protein